MALTSSNPAKIFGLYPQKGSLSIGSDADIVLVDLEREEVVNAESWKTSAGYNLYEGSKLKGWPVATLLRGELIFKDGQVVGPPGVGRFLPRTCAAS